jgi:transposase InsO family protein
MSDHKRRVGEKKEDKAPPGGRARPGREAGVVSPPRPHRPRPYPYAIRQRAVQLHLEEGLDAQLVAQELGTTAKSVYKWAKLYRQFGVEGLKDHTPGGASSQMPAPVRQKIVALKRDDPQQGVRRISQVLRRLFWLKASPETVRHELAGAGLMTPRKKPRHRGKVPPRRFERATPNQMWQSDITYYPILGKTAYIIGFIDDHSRYITGLGVYRSQPSVYVVELYRAAAAQYGAPREMLTDNGRQYASWRGTTPFQKELQKDHVHHLRSAPQHPMTLGKIERFWQTLKEEFLSKARFETFEEARERIAWWMQYYNHKRPHQAMDGLCPADRFFSIQKEMREAIERGVAANVEELAQRGKPLEPFYMVGRMGEQSVVIATENKRMSVRVDGRELPADHPLVYDLTEGGSNDETRRNNRDAASASHAELQCEGKEPGGAVAVERPPQCRLTDEDDGRVVGGLEQLGETRVVRDAERARPHLAENDGGRRAAAPCGTVDAAGRGTGHAAGPELNPEEPHENADTGSLRSRGEVPRRAGGVDGTQAGVEPLPGTGGERVAVLAVAGPGALGYAGGAGTARDERGGRGAGTAAADPAPARPQGQDAGSPDPRPDGAGAPSGTTPAPARSASGTGEVSACVNATRGPEGARAHAGDPGAPGGADQRHPGGADPGRVAAGRKLVVNHRCKTGWSGKSRTIQPGSGVWQFLHAVA